MGCPRRGMSGREVSETRGCQKVGVPETVGCPRCGGAGTTVLRIGASAIQRSAEEGAAVRSPGAFSTPLPHSFFSLCSGLFADCAEGPTSLPQNFFVDFETSRKIHRQAMPAEWTELTPVVKPCPLLALPYPQCVDRADRLWRRQEGQRLVFRSLKSSTPASKGLLVLFVNMYFGCGGFE